ncbi:polyribonucleotide nucleotidyltransferase [Planctomycetota bacterium]|nr:polyribonucleotide nucleotidyltransferase [Planctomycetota bacterium]
MTSPASAPQPLQSREEALAALGMQKHTVTIAVGATPITIETGYVAKQAAGSVLVRSGDTVVLSTVCDGDPRAGLDFFPLTVDYREKHYAAGRIPGNFFRREARPSDHETLISRLTDRPLRPLFPAGYKRDTSCQSLVLSYDQVNESDVLSMIGVSASLMVSHIPFQGPIGAVRIGRIDNALVINPTVEQRKASTLDLIVAGTKDAITMVECGAQEIPEAVMVEALTLAHQQVQIICAAIAELQAKAGKPKMVVADPPTNPWVAKILAESRATLRTALLTANKHQRSSAVKAERERIVTALAATVPEAERDAAALAIKNAFGDAKDVVFRDLILDGKRVDGRSTSEVRPIVIDLDQLPRTHGSVLFTRGETQALMTCTLGTAEDELLIDGLKPKYSEWFLLNYNFPGFSVGEVEKRGSPGRREIGHGALARRALVSVLPKREEFPYCIRLVSEITESNGSSSMATVCSGSMALMSSGVPITAPVAGIAMGLVMEGDRYAILTDILGDEDHYGDMDFKVCGTEKGLTALQMDIKISGISADLMAKALEQARQGRLHILRHMNAAISTARTQLSPLAPQIVQVQIDPELIGKIIGKGGETIRRIQEESGAKLNVDDDGIITIASPDLASIEKAKGWISDLTEKPEVGKTYHGTVTSIKEFGAFVEFIPETEGLVHISEWDTGHVKSLEGIAKVGDAVDVKLIEVDERTGKFRLSRRALLPGGDAPRTDTPRSDSGPRGDARPAAPRVERKPAAPTEQPEIGKTYTGRVTSVRDFGAFIEFVPGIEGLLHISEWDMGRVERMDDVAQAGDTVQVKLLEIDPKTGKYRLSRRALLPGGDAPRPERPARSGGDRGPSRR